jgi:hypothetical protein
MKDLNKIICNTMHKFVNEHIDEVKDSYSNLGFKDSVDMLNQIKNNIETAIWALTELCYYKELSHPYIPLGCIFVVVKKLLELQYNFPMAYL